MPYNHTPQGFAGSTEANVWICESVKNIDIATI